MVRDRIDEAAAAVERREAPPDPLEQQIQRAIWRSFWAFIRRERAKDTRW